MTGKARHKDASSTQRSRFRFRPRWLIPVFALAAALVYVGFVALQVPGLGVDEGAHITHAVQLRQGHLASHEDVMSPELSAVSRCERFRVLGATADPGYPIGSRTGCYPAQQVAAQGLEIPAQQAQHTPIYYLPLAFSAKVVDKVTDLDPLVDTYRIAGLIFTALSAGSLLWLARSLKVSPWVAAAGVLAIVGASNFAMSHAFVNNDALAIPGGVAMLLAARRVLKGTSPAVLLFAVSFAVTLAKPTFIVAQAATALYLLQSLEPTDLRWRELNRGSTKRQWVDRMRTSAQRLAPTLLVGAGLVAGTIAFQLWIQYAVPGRRGDFTTFYKSRLFQADHLQDTLNSLHNPLSLDVPVSFVDPSYGLLSMSVLESVMFVGTVLVALGLYRRWSRDATRLARSALGSLFLGPLLLFATASARGGAVLSTNTRYLLPAVPFMFAAVVLAADGSWDRFVPRLPKASLAVVAILALGVQAVAFTRTPDPRDNNAWTQRQAGVMASFVKEAVADPDGCLSPGDKVAVIPFMPKLYQLAPGIHPPTDPASYWEPTLSRKERGATFNDLEASDLDAVIITDFQQIGFERRAAGRITAEWKRCTTWQPQDLGPVHRPYQVYVRP